MVSMPGKYLTEGYLLVILYYYNQDYSHENNI